MKGGLLSWGSPFVYYGGREMDQPQEHQADSEVDGPNRDRLGGRFSSCAE